MFGILGPQRSRTQSSKKGAGRSKFWKMRFKWDMSYSLNFLKGDSIGDYIGKYHEGSYGGYWEFRL